MASSSSHVRARSDEHNDESDFAKMIKSQRVDNDATILVAHDDAGMDKFDRRAAVRLQTKNAVEGGMYTIHFPPSVHSLMSVLCLLRKLLLAQDHMRHPQDGTLNHTAFQRADPVSALARTANDEGDVKEAALKMLAIIQQIYDYVTARTAERDGQGFKVARGREPSRSAEERSREAPAWPQAKGGYAPFNTSIDYAASPEGVQSFHAYAKQPSEADAATLAKKRREHPDLQHPEAPPRIPNVETMCPGGDVVQPPLFVAAAARKSKSVPMITILGVTLLMPKAKVAISVAPNKIGPLNELLKKIQKTGWIEAGIARVVTTLGAQGKKDPAEAIVGFHEANVLLYSHEVEQDITTFTAWVDHANANGHAVISIHDEADTLVKKLLKDDAPPDTKAPAVERLRLYYALHKTRTILVGATLLPTLQDDSLWGSQLHKTPHDVVKWLNEQGYGMLTPPLDPTDQHVQYIGIENFKDAMYSEEDPANPYAFTRKLALARMKKLRPECRHVQVWGAKALLRAAQSKPVEPQALDEDGTMETLAEAQARHDALVAKRQEDLDIVEDKTIGDYYKPDEVLPQAMMPSGNVHLYYDEAATAMLDARTAAFIATPPLEPATKRRQDDPEQHMISKSLVVSCTSTQQNSKTDQSGGLAGFTKLATKEAKAQGQPVGVLLWSSIPHNGIANSTGVAAAADNANASDQVKLFVVRPMTEDDDGFEGGDDWMCEPFTAHVDAPTALAKAHAVFAEKGFAELIPHMRVIYVGYDMFAAATTLSCSNHTIVVNGATVRVHYLPKSMVLCHAKNKQLNVLYQMLGRSMNLLQSIVLDGYVIDVLTHANTLPRVDCYYRIEQYMVKCMKGATDLALREPRAMMGALVAFAEGQTERFGLDVADFLGKGRVGLRNSSLFKILDKGDKLTYKYLVSRADYHVPQAAPSSSPAESDCEEEEDDDDAATRSTVQVAKDTFGWSKCIGKEEAEWALDDDQPHYKTKLNTSGTEGDLNASRLRLMERCTKEEKDALKSLGGKATTYADLTDRVLPTWFALLWVLKYQQAKAASPTEAAATLVASVKSQTYRDWGKTRRALSFLILSGQFVPLPDEASWVVQLTTFTKQLGDTPERRREALRHMLRILKWDTKWERNKDNPNHSNHVNNLHNFLERLLECDDVFVVPWSMPAAIKKKPDWFAADSSILSGKTHDNDADACKIEEFTLDKIYGIQDMSYLLL